MSSSGSDVRAGRRDVLHHDICFRVDAPPILVSAASKASSFLSLRVFVDRLVMADSRHFTRRQWSPAKEDCDLKPCFYLNTPA